MLFFFISLILIIGVLIIYINEKIIGYVTYPVDYSIGDYAAFNLDSDAIHFGTVVPGAVIKRTLKIATSVDALIDVNLYNLENLAMSKDYFLLEANETEDLTLTLFAPFNAEKGYYSGKIVILYYNPD